MNGLEFLPLVIIVLVFWLFVIRPASRQRRDAMQLQDSLEVGDKIVLTSGIYGTITGIHEARMDLEVAPGTTIVVDRRAVGAVERAPETGDDYPDSEES